MACSYISSSSISGNFHNGGLTLTAPATIQNNDILIINLYIEDDITPTPPTGFTQWQNIDSPAAAMDSWTWWKRASSESGSYGVTWTGNPWSEAFMMCIRGAVTTGTPEDPAPTSNNGNSTTYTATGLTTTVDGDEIIYIADFFTAPGLGTPPTGTTPTFLERYDPNSDIYVATGEMSPAGATGNKARNTGTSGAWVASLVSVKAAVAAGTTTPQKIINVSQAVQRSATR